MMAGLQQMNCATLSLSLKEDPRELEVEQLPLSTSSPTPGALVATPTQTSDGDQDEWMTVHRGGL
jgi:hypothetical protein